MLFPLLGRKRARRTCPKAPKRLSGHSGAAGPGGQGSAPFRHSQPGRGALTGGALGEARGCLQSLQTEAAAALHSLRSDAGV